MARLRKLPGKRTVLLLAAGAVMFLLWLGLWLRVLPDRPRVSIPAPEGTEIVSVSNNGRWVLTRPIPSPAKVEEFGFMPGGPPKVGPLRVWDTQAGSVDAEFLGSEDYCDKVEVSPDGRFVVVDLTVSRREQIRLFESPGARELKMSPLTDRSIWSCFSPDGRRFAYSRQAYPTPPWAVFVWNITKERPKLELIGFGGPLAFSPDSSRLASRTIDDRGGPAQVVVTEIATGNEVGRFPYAGVLREIIFSPADGRLLAIKTTPDAPDSENRDHVVVYDLDSGLEADRHMSSYLFAFHADGSQFVVSTVEEKRRMGSAVDYFTASPRGKLLIRCRHRAAEQHGWLEGLARTIRKRSEEDTGPPFRMHELATGRLLCLIDSRSSYELSDDESVAACIGPNGHIEVWDLPPRRPIFTLLALAALPALLFTAVIWWRLVRG